MRWKCSKKASFGCRASLSTNLDHSNPVPGQPHNHPGDETVVTYTKFRNDMRDQATSSLDKPAQIFAQTVTNMSAQVQVLLPIEKNVKHSLRYHRKAPPVPQNLHDLVIPDDCKMTMGPEPEPFLIYDNGPESNCRIIAFTTESDLHRLCSADTLFMDGNFAMAPAQFSQIYVLRVPFRDVSVTCVYALLQYKTRVTYDELFQAIVEKCDQLGLEMQIQTVVTDFEEAVLRAVAGVFGRGVDCHGCFYHLTQSTLRKIQQLGLSHHYKADEEFRQFCGMLDGLAFLPVDDIPEGMDYLKSIAPAEGGDLVDYFDKTYVSGTFRMLQAGDNNVLRMRQVPPLYPPRIWNVYDATLANNPRTNNVCEGWNNKFFSFVGHHHPSIWKLFQWFQKEHATFQTMISQAAVGNPPRKQVNMGLERLQIRLKTLCEDYLNGSKNMTEFLAGVGHNIQVNKRYETE